MAFRLGPPYVVWELGFRRLCSLSLLKFVGVCYAQQAREALLCLLSHMTLTREVDFRHQHGPRALVLRCVDSSDFDVCAQPDIFQNTVALFIFEESLRICFYAQNTHVTVTKFRFSTCARKYILTENS